MKRPLLIASTLLTLTSAAFAQQRDMSAVPIDVKNVSGSVYMLVGAGGNVGFSAGDDGVVIIDDQFAPLAPRIREAIQKVSAKPIRFVLNTHLHGDHTGGNPYFSELAPIAAHENVRRRLLTQIDDPKRGVTAKTLPMLTYGEGISIHMNGEEVRVMHFPSGHTDGDSMVYFTRSNVLHMGDDFFNGRFPFIDLSSGGSVDGAISAVEKVLGMMPADVKIIPGHGALATTADLRTYLQMLRDTSRIVRAGVAEGKTAAQLKEAKVLSAFDKYSWDFISADRFIDTLVQDASTRKTVTKK